MSSTQQPQDPTPAPEQPNEIQPAEPAPATEPAPEGDKAEGQAEAESDLTPEEQPAEETPAEEQDEEPAEEQPQVVSGPLAVPLEMMLFEAGMIANSLSSKGAGAELANKLHEAEQEAEAEGKVSLTFQFSVFEAGMALNAMSRSQDGTMDKLQELLHGGLIDLMNEYGVEPLGNDQGGGTL